jgi:DNA-binding GntR family transcriptional regulator
MQTELDDTGYVTRVYTAVREMVIRYDYRPCHRLDIGEIATRLRVSRTPVREALNRLLNESLVVQYNNRGFYTRPLDLTEILALLELRHVLAGAAARFACDRADDIALAALGTAPTTGCSPEGSHARLVAQLIDLSGNVELRKVWENVEARLHYFSIVYLTNQVRYADEQRVRAALLAGVEKRDVAVAASVLAGAHQAILARAQDVVKEAFAALYVGRDGTAAPLTGTRLLRTRSMAGS